MGGHKKTISKEWIAKPLSKGGLGQFADLREAWQERERGGGGVMFLREG